jgi:hypothetical protein
MGKSLQDPDPEPKLAVWPRGDRFESLARIVHDDLPCSTRRGFQVEVRQIFHIAG